MVEKIREILKKHQGQLPIIVMAEILSVMDEEEVCEWKRNENTKAIILSPHNPHSAMWAVDVKMYPYCNCCGKKIKVVEVE